MSQTISIDFSPFKAWILCVVTLLLTVALNFAVQRGLGYDIFSITLWFIVPVGAVLLAFCAVSGFAVASLQSGRRANFLDLIFLMCVCFALQILVVAADYISLRLSGLIPPGVDITFYGYFFQNITAAEYVSHSSRFGTSAASPVGDFGWFLLVPRVASLLAIAKVTHKKFAASNGYELAQSYENYR
ncbi:hypothetical protein [Iodobacter fluviatilis]|uniref:Uncharacterized protein n=1 Tax=Iodobacter fluviatilis TaxID=537 RepID=A0A377Q9L7_9NEIS|nr:hypothetical protein [Iodobacter fluviatilis]TCU81393.1 hypothetical protein EV682_12231 [Iodobacter fluviatilis]STQ91964.1 Uncharacterised protein [Iodobacter fluviatilis]